ncbi:hypothetical protein [Acinetobacter sp. 983759]|uniref:hypothetical protein n=1 Tax=Acinetobacter sp. 983759 TaxID=1310660 RepID=UPI0005538F33|nr:hypothetical protein [Acinetobacter sp. 983759]
MNAAVKTQVMDWSKHTIEEWLKQYGAYIQTCRMRGGSAPNDLGINQIYWLVCESIGEVKRKDQAICMIDDYEAEQVRKLIYDVKTSERICKSAKVAVSLFIEKNVRGMSLSQMEKEFALSRSSINNMVFAGSYYLAGHDKRLRLK